MSDLSLTPYHVNHSKLFVEQHFSNVKEIDIKVIKSNIEHTRFPAPKNDNYSATDNYPGLVRAADFIGQMAGINYPKKVGCLFN